MLQKYSIGQELDAHQLTVWILSSLLLLELINTGIEKYTALELTKRDYSSIIFPSESLFFVYVY